MGTDRETGRRASWRLPLWVLALSAGCGGAAKPPSPVAAPAANVQAPPTQLLGASKTPTLFLSAASDAPAIGWTSPDLAVTPTGPDEGGRTPVRIAGPLRVKAYVPTQLLGVKVQRRGRLRGSAVYVGPNDWVQVLGREPDGRLRVRARVRVAGRELGPFEGTFPAIGVAAQPAPSDAKPPRPGKWHALAAGTPLALHESPGGAVQVTVPASDRPIPVEVLNTQGGWAAVRVGEGPYLIGYTNAALEPLATPPPRPARAQGVPPLGPNQLPTQLQQEPGPLKRVAQGAKLTFSGQVIAAFEQPGWARVLAEYPNGLVDVFCAVDNGVAVRGLVEQRFLSTPPAAP